METHLAVQLHWGGRKYKIDEETLKKRTITLPTVTVMDWTRTIQGNIEIQKDSQTNVSTAVC